MKIFMDQEFTGLHQYTTQISIGMVTEFGDTFYAELTDYDENQVTEWIVDNVIDNLYLTDEHCKLGEDKFNVRIKGDSKTVKEAMEDWFEDIMDVYEDKEIEMWGDCMAYDWVLFCQIFGHAFNIPLYINYIPFDICTLFKMAGVDPDINREKFAGMGSKKEKHNALHDALVVKACFDKVVNMITVLKK